MDLRRDNSGTVIEPEFHDGQLLGFVLSPSDQSLTIFCQTVDKLDYVIRVPSLVRFRGDDFREGNIIFDISIREGRAIPPSAVRKVWSYDDAAADKFLTSRLEEIGRGKWALLEVTSSYGGQLLAISRSAASSLTITAAKYSSTTTTRTG